MVGIKIINKNKTTSIKTNIEFLSDYIISPISRKKIEKCTYYNFRDPFLLKSFDKSIDIIQMSMKNVCFCNKRSKDPISHYVLSFSEGETPSHEQVENIIDEFEKVFEVQGYQILYGLHQGTNNSHIHIMLNRVQPDSIMDGVEPRVKDVFRDFEKINKVAAIIEYKQGWKKLEENPRFSVTEKVNEKCEKEIVVQENFQKSDKRKTHLNENKEKKYNEESISSLISKKVLPIIVEIEKGQSWTWQDLHSSLATQGIIIQRRGSGLVFGAKKEGENDITFVKASSIKRKMLPTLEKFLGQYNDNDFDENIINNIQELESKPFLNFPFYDEYQNYLKQVKIEREASEKKREEIRAKYDSELKVMHDNYIADRDKILSSISDGKQRNLKSREMKSEYLEKIGEIKKSKKINLDEILVPKKMSFEDFLIAKNEPALAEIYRNQGAFNDVHSFCNRNGIISTNTLSSTSMNSLYYAYWEIREKKFIEKKLQYENLYLGCEDLKDIYNEMRDLYKSQCEIKYTNYELYWTTKQDSNLTVLITLLTTIAEILVGYVNYYNIQDKQKEIEEIKNDINKMKENNREGKIDQFPPGYCFSYFVLDLATLGLKSAKEFLGFIKSSVL